MLKIKMLCRMLKIVMENFYLSNNYRCGCRNVLYYKENLLLMFNNFKKFFLILKMW